MNDINYGAIKQEPKISDILLGSVNIKEPIPKVFMPDQIEVEMQDKHPACGAHAGAHFKRIQENNGKRLSPEYLWKRIKQIDPFKPEEGTSMEFVFKALQKFGICEYDILPNNTSQSLAKYSDWTTLTTKMDTSAKKNKIETYAFEWNPTFEQLKEAIYKHKVVIVRFDIGPEFWTPSWKEKHILPLTERYNPTSGHFMVASGYDEKYVYGPNSFGMTWGKAGYWYAGKEYIESRCNQIGSAVDVSDIVYTAFLKQGSKGSAVSLLQKRLGISIDGIFGPQTKMAVMAFQKSKKLVPDGIVGPNTNKALNEL